MKKLLLFSLALSFSAILNAQVSGFDNDAFGFELTNVTWNSSSNHNGATSPGNIVDGWTQVDGFAQSSEQANSGTYSMLADFSSAIPAATPKLQTWRVNASGEGKFDYATEDNYTMMANVYITDALTDGTLIVTSQQNGGQYNQLVINLSSITPNQWTPFMVSFDQEDPKSGYWSSVNFGVLPSSNVKVYIDDISIVLSSTLSTGSIDASEYRVVSNSGSGSLDVFAPSNAKISLYNTVGNKLKEFSSSEESYSFDVSDLSTGVYISKIVSDGKIWTQKFIIQ